MPVSQPLRISPLRNLDSLVKSLRTEGLPHADIYEPQRDFFELQRGDQLVGYVGLEGNTADRLLRSFLVLPSHRGEGIGAQALKTLETLLVSQEIESLHLLTTTAEPFFQRCGFEKCDRAAAPFSVTSTLEFRNLCPSTATYMVKRLLK